MLFQRVVKLVTSSISDFLAFESSVISEGSKTARATCLFGFRFESSVISEGSKTLLVTVIP